MAISDLTGTTWYMNETVNGTSLFTKSTWNITLYTDYYYDTSISDYVFLESYTSITCNTRIALHDDVYEIMFGGNTEFYEGTTLSNLSFYNPYGDCYRYVKITGGSDATNSTLIAWFEANATQIGPVPSIIQNLFIGQPKMIDGYLGNARISQIYYGNILVWERDDGPTPVIDNALLTSEGNYIVDSSGGYLITAPPTSGNN